MNSMTRREFLGRTAAGATAAGFMLTASGTADANPLGLPIGSQTYPHRAMIADGKFVDLLKQLKSIGIDQIELCGYLGGDGYPEFKTLADGKATRKLIEDNGLKAVSCHFLFPELRDNLAKAIAWSKDVGLEQMMIPTVKSGATSGTVEEAKVLADQFNKMAVDINKAGMGDGWETSRRRGPGYDWAIVRLGTAGLISKIEIDTNHFKGNYPESASLEGALAPGTQADNLPASAWKEILPRVTLQPDHRHVFRALNDVGAVSHVRLNIFPDGGISRLRVYGTVAGD